jgi:hypothetical protein
MKDAVYLRGWDWCFNQSQVRDYQHHICMRNMYEKHCTNRRYYRIPSMAVYAYISKRKCPTFKGPQPLLWAGTRVARAKIKRSGTPNPLQLCNFRRETIRFVRLLYVFMSVWNTSAPSRWIFMKFGIWVFFENLSRQFNSLKSDQSNGCFTWHTFVLSHLAQCFLKWEMI